jgi:signal transduction histidine kinase
MFSPRDLYLWTVGLLGSAIVVWSLALILTLDPGAVFFLLIVFAIVAQLTATMLAADEITVEVGTAVSIAVVALYGPLAGSLVAACVAIGVSLSALYRHWPGWPRAMEHMVFNIGVVTTALFIAGSTFQFTQNALGPETVAGQTIPWLLAAIIHDQINLWLLIGLFHLQSEADVIEIWREHRWMTPINVLVISVGGGLLTFAVDQFGVIGVGIFFLPIVLVAYALRLYVNQTEQKIAQLEALVAARTADLQKSKRELETLHKSNDSFLAVLTHDMRNPLSNIKSYAGVLRKGNLSPEQQVHISQILMRSQESLMEIVNNILEIEQLQSGAPINLDTTEFDLAYLATLTAESAVAQAAEKDIIIHYDKEPEPIMVRGDRAKIKRVLMNLVSNAIKYTREDGLISVATEGKEAEAIVRVSDTGYGIPADELPYIFNRYRRVKGHRHLAVGTGLGLAIVKSLVEAHDGEILVESRENDGSVFIVRLPRDARRSLPS